MTFANITALRIPEGAELETEKRLVARRRAVGAAEGFEGFESLRSRSGEDRYFVVTCRDTREHYDAWVAGRDTSAHADDERRGTSIELLGLEVVQYGEQSGRIVTATQATVMTQVRVVSLQVMPLGSQFLTVMVVIPGETLVRVSNASAGA